MATYAIGDVQGCFDELAALLGEIGFAASRDRLWFVGDLVNRGPKSLEVLRFVRALGERATVVLGNHDLHLLRLAAGIGKANRGDTLDAVLDAPDRDELVAWLRTRLLLHAEDDHLMMHAGLLPSWTAAQARDLAREVEEALRGKRYRDVLAELSSGPPHQWRDDLRGPERLRVVTSALTRLRFCNADGLMDLKAKGRPDEAPPGFLPWFDVPGRRTRDVTVVCGHWSVLGLHVRPRLLAIDSGCVWGASLTAIRLEDRKVYQRKCAGAAEPDRR
jgi:bis(5'-nucleosyl)-tetraphosphatase (symmetrical)